MRQKIYSYAISSYNVNTGGSKHKDLYDKFTLTGYLNKWTLCPAWCILNRSKVAIIFFIICIFVKPFGVCTWYTCILWGEEM